MKAFIMAAGFGTRLEPLTLAVPKPMVYVANKPIMQHNIALLAKAGFREICANIHYFPEQIENYFGIGADFGVKLSYSYEESLLGTAGGVRRMAEVSGGVDGTFLVLSADALTDIDLEALISFHKKKKAIGTIALYPVIDTSQFGVVVLDGSGRVEAFQEKPPVGKALSNMANTGIYVFEPEILKMIPKNEFYDFGKQLFPRLVKEGKDLYGYEMKEYWSDVGSLEQYISANADVLNRSVSTHLPLGQNEDQIWVGKNVTVGRNVVLNPPLLLGDDVMIKEGVHLTGPSVVGEKCVIEPHSRISGSILWSEVHVGAHSDIEGSILGSWVTLEPHVRIGQECVVGNRHRIGRGTVLEKGTRLPPDGGR